MMLSNEVQNLNNGAMWENNAHAKGAWVVE
jgi:hypothetical protein